MPPGVSINQQRLGAVGAGLGNRSFGSDAHRLDGVVEDELVDQGLLGAQRGASGTGDQALGQDRGQAREVIARNARHGRSLRYFSSFSFGGRSGSAFWRSSSWAAVGGSSLRASPASRLASARLPAARCLSVRARDKHRPVLEGKGDVGLFASGCSLSPASSRRLRLALGLIDLVVGCLSGRFTLGLKKQAAVEVIPGARAEREGALRAGRARPCRASFTCSRAALRKATSSKLRAMPLRGSSFALDRRRGEGRRRSFPGCLKRLGLGVIGGGVSSVMALALRPDRLRLTARS